MRIRTTTVALVALAVLGLAGCSSSSGGSDDDAPAAPGTAAAIGRPDAGKAAGDDGKAALTAAVKAYITAFFKPDAEGVIALLSTRCAAGHSVTEMKQILAASMLTYGTPTVKSIEVNSLSGDRAKATVHYVKPPMPETPQSWVREAGAWKFDAC
jgi:hypothetical protein